MKLLVTGTAGFIGFHAAKAFLDRGDTVLGVDNFNDYYDPELKQARNLEMQKHQKFEMRRGDICDLTFVRGLFTEQRFDAVVHLAAYANVLHSIQFPHLYVQSNIAGFTNVIDEAKNAGIKRFIYASSSSLYGDNNKLPSSVEQRTDESMNMYAASKKANELIAYTYHHLYGMQCTGLRFFTVYGPWGRPDMAIWLFIKGILDGKPIKVFNFGNMKRNFVYVDDVVRGVVAALDKSYPYEVFNIAAAESAGLMDVISCIEKETGKTAMKDLLPLQPGDPVETSADIKHSIEKLGFEPQITIEEGIRRMVEWYREFYGK